MLTKQKARRDLAQVVDEILQESQTNLIAENYETERKIIELAEYGLTVNEILEFMNLRDSPDLQNAIAQGRINGIKKVKRALYLNAISGEPLAVDYYLNVLREWSF